MLLFVLAYVGGLITIISPCILPVLPFVFARVDRPFLRNGLPMLAGMAISFAAIAGLTTVVGGWVVQVNQYARVGALALLAFFGLTLLFPGIADRLTRPIVRLGGGLSQWTEQRAGAHGSGVLSSALLGVATGLLWAPCAGPILGLILTGAALQGASIRTSLLLLAFAAGAATSLALALLLGGRVFAAMKKSLAAGEWLRRALGAAVLVAAAVILLGVDTGFLTHLSVASTTSAEQWLLDKFHFSAADRRGTTEAGRAVQNAGLPIKGEIPSLSGATEWLNSGPLTTAELKGRVVLVDFWTYSCINCLRALPYVRAWSEKYKDAGLVVIGVHSPEFAFEKNVDNVRKAVADLNIHYPVAIDNDYALWRAFHNQYWPAHYFIDSQGRIRHEHFGEGAYDESERVIQKLLAEAGNGKTFGDLVSVHASGVEAAPDSDEVETDETYVGYHRGENFVSPGGAVKDTRHLYTVGTPDDNEWGLSGVWTVESRDAILHKAGGRIVFRFHARDLHLVLGPAPDGKPVRFRIRLDGAPPGTNHGVDVDATGHGTVTGQRLYQLIRQSGTISDRTFEIEFLDPGVRAYAFTFG